MFGKFHTDRHYLLRYLLTWCLVLGGVTAVLWQPPGDTGHAWLLAITVGLIISARFDALLLSVVPAVLMTPAPLTTVLWLVVLLPLTWTVGIWAAVFVHNASHEQFRPRWLNRPLGELMCWALRTNLMGWTLVHGYHHRYADDPERDPHSPGRMTFWPYANQMGRASYLYLDARHREAHGLPAAYYLLPGIAGLVSFALMPLSWLMLLGPTAFAAIWLPILCAGWWLFTVINFHTHPIGADGHNHAVDLDGRGWHKAVNRIGFGVLHHAVHHRHAYAFDPRRAQTARSG
jgi:fatty acid desaturase